LLCVVAAAAGVLTEADAGVWLRDALARALEANQRWEQLAGELHAENERLRTENAALRAEAAWRDAELEQVKAGLAVLQRMVFGRSSEQARPGPAGRGDGGGEGERGGPARRRGPGARAGRRDYSDLPRVEVVWDFEGGGYWCPECCRPFERLGEHVAELVDWEPELADRGAGPAGGGAVGGHADWDLRGYRGAAGPAGGGDHRPVPGLLAPAR
jgi:hypothetical protein